MDEPVDATFLIVGAGPAGASLACFLASYGFGGIMISSASGTATEPRAHITNAAALECLRDLGLEAECYRLATPGNCMQHTRWCYSMAGEEIARTYAWGNQPDGSYQTASPCHHVDLPQTLLEPILVGYATKHQWVVRYNSTFVDYQKRGDKLVSSINDDVTGQTWKVTSKYLFGCDGARSQVLRQVGIPLIRQPSRGRALNVLVNADLRHLMRARTGNLHWILQPGQQHPWWGWCCVMRMVKAWDEWVLIFYPHPDSECMDERPTRAECQARVRAMIGDETPVHILSVAVWYIHEVVAERYSDGNVFCLGDATHRHPPAYGLGNNTCIQDAYNLAWKLAYVERSQANPCLLASFTLERQPVGASIIRHANQGIRDNMPIWEALGMLPRDLEERKRQHAELVAATKAGQKRRQSLQDAIKYAAREYRAIGVEMNQSYKSGAIYFRDEEGVRQWRSLDPVLHYQTSTYPGSRLPHAWVNKRVPMEIPLSTLDLVGHRKFCLITGVGGDEWKHAFFEVGRTLSIDVNAYTIGWMQDWEDVYDDWAQHREVEEDGCILCRPDRTVCWRSPGMQEKCGTILLRVMRSLLGHTNVSM